jgi:hypothetical protein
MSLNHANEVKGESMLALSRDLRTSYKTAFVVAHKLREAMAAELKSARSARVGLNTPGRCAIRAKPVLSLRRSDTIRGPKQI